MVPGLKPLLNSVQPVPLRVGSRLEALGTGGLIVVVVLVNSFLHGRDEVAEQHLGRSSLDAVEALVDIRQARRSSDMHCDRLLVKLTVSVVAFARDL